MRLLSARRAYDQMRGIVERETSRNPEHVAWMRYHIDLLRARPEWLGEMSQKPGVNQWLYSAEWEAHRNSEQWEAKLMAAAPDTPFATYFALRALLYHRRYDMAREFSFKRRAQLSGILLQDLQLYNKDYPVNLRVADITRMMRSQDHDQWQLAIGSLMRFPQTAVWAEVRPSVLANLPNYPKPLLFDLFLIDLENGVSDHSILRALYQQYPNLPFKLSSMYAMTNPADSTLFYRTAMYFSVPMDVIWSYMIRFAETDST
jgi:hypothetical protein